MQDRVKTHEWELSPRYDARASFYGKAVEIYYSDGTIQLRSYSTIVAAVIPHPDSPNTAEVYGWFSNTTGRHIKEFLKQHGFKADTKSQILKDYSAE